jgi:thioredoxin 1
MYSSFSDLGVDPQKKNQENYEDCFECTNITQKKDIISSHSLVCVDIYATWCKPCMDTAPAYAELARKYNQPGVCALIKEKYESRLTNPSPGGLPTYQFYKNGQKLPHEVVGADLTEVERIIQENLENKNVPTSVSGGNKSSIRNFRPLSQKEDYNSTQGNTSRDPRYQHY